MENAKIVISTDSISDLGTELLKKYNIPFFPLAITLGDVTEYDGEGMPDKIFEYVEKSGKTPKTAARGEEEYVEFFNSIKPKDGAVVHFCISKELSASYENALRASKAVPNVYVVDTRSLSTGAGLNVLYAIDLLNEGVEAEEIFNRCSLRADKAQASFVLDSLEFLYKGGRCSGIALFVSNILKIKPMIMLKDGKMVVGKKYIARFDKAVEKYVGDILDSYNKPDLTRVFITYTTCADEIVESVKKQILERYPFKEVLITNAGGTVTSHCGKNTIGILYFNDL